MRRAPRRGDGRHRMVIVVVVVLVVVLGAGLISIPIFGLRPSLRQTPLSTLIGGITTRSVSSGFLSLCL
jgi:hypothetical protein